VNKDAVLEGFPFGIPYDDLEKKLKKDVPERLQKVSGKLNVFPASVFNSGQKINVSGPDYRSKSEAAWIGIAPQLRVCHVRGYLRERQNPGGF